MPLPPGGRLDGPDPSQPPLAVVLDAVISPLVLDGRARKQLKVAVHTNTRGQYEEALLMFGRRPARGHFEHPS